MAVSIADIRSCLTKEQNEGYKDYQIQWWIQHKKNNKFEVLKTINNQTINENRALNLIMDPEKKRVVMKELNLRVMHVIHVKEQHKMLMFVDPRNKPVQFNEQNATDALLLFMYFLQHQCETLEEDGAKAIMMVDISIVKIPSISELTGQARMFSGIIGRSFPKIFEEIICCCNFGRMFRMAITTLAKTAGLTCTFSNPREVLQRFGPQNIPTTLGGKVDLNSFSPLGERIEEFFAKRASHRIFNEERMRAIPRGSSLYSQKCSYALIRSMSGSMRRANPSESVRRTMSVTGMSSEPTSGGLGHSPTAVEGSNAMLEDPFASIPVVESEASGGQLRSTVGPGMTCVDSSTANSANDLMLMKGESNEEHAQSLAGLERIILVVLGVVGIVALWEGSIGVVVCTLVSLAFLWKSGHWWKLGSNFAGIPENASRATQLYHLILSDCLEVCCSVLTPVKDTIDLTDVIQNQDNDINLQKAILASACLLERADRERVTQAIYRWRIASNVYYGITSEVLFTTEEASILQERCTQLNSLWYLLHTSEATCLCGCKESGDLEFFCAHFYQNPIPRKTVLRRLPQLGSPAMAPVVTPTHGPSHAPVAARLDPFTGNAFTTTKNHNGNSNSSGKPSMPMLHPVTPTFSLSPVTSHSAGGGVGGAISTPLSATHVLPSGVVAPEASAAVGLKPIVKKTTALFPSGASPPHSPKISFAMSPSITSVSPSAAVHRRTLSSSEAPTPTVLVSSSNTRGGGGTAAAYGADINTSTNTMIVTSSSSLRPPYSGGGGGGKVRSRSVPVDETPLSPSLTPYAPRYNHGSGAEEGMFTSSLEDREFQHHLYAHHPHHRASFQGGISSSGETFGVNLQEKSGRCCANCQKKFGRLFRLKHRCQSCQQPFCSSCAEMHMKFHRSYMPLQRYFVCKDCAAKEKKGGSGSGSGSGSGIVGGTSGGTSTGSPRVPNSSSGGGRNFSSSFNSAEYF